MTSVAEHSFDLIYKLFHHGRSRSAEAKHREELSRAPVVVRKGPPSRPSIRKNLSQTSLLVYPQPQSLFFTKLPPEIRQYIYESLLGSRAFIVTHKSNRLVNQTYTVPGSAEDQFGTIPIDVSCWDLAEQNRYGERNGIAHQVRGVSISLLLTCHAIYAESISILYNCNIFCTSTPLDLVYLYDYTILPQRFADIRHLQLKWSLFGRRYPEDRRIGSRDVYATWMRFWDLAAGMGLRSLGLFLMIYGEEEERTIEAIWVRPLLKLKGIQDVRLTLHARVGFGIVIPLEDLTKEIEEQWMSI